MSSELGGALYGLESEAGQDQKIEVDQEGAELFATNVGIWPPRSMKRSCC